MRLYLNGVGVYGPGMLGWLQAREVLCGVTEYSPQPLVLPTPALLPPAERRRSPATVKLAVQVAQEACSMAHADPASLPSVFASSHGDTEISDYMCTELAQAEPGLSPTRFHNSVHNAASGYWTIAVGCKQAANAISAGADSFGAGLLEAAALAVCDDRPVLLVAYDIAAPKVLMSVCPISQSFAVAWVIAKHRSNNSVAQLTLQDDLPGNVLPLPAFLLPLIASNPAAQALPILHAIATQSSSAHKLAGMIWEVAPCK